MLHLSSKFSLYQYLLTSSRLKTVFLLSTNHRVENIVIVSVGGFAFDSWWEVKREGGAVYTVAKI
jgi:hypothetical protein